jgi:mRNA interferase MazF
VRRGEIYLANLSPRSGSEQQGRRPVIVVSNDGFNRTPRWRSVIVVPVSTSHRQHAHGPTAVELRKGDGGLDNDCVALCHQVTTLDRSKLVHCLGILSSSGLGSVERGLAVALALP